MNWYIQNNCFNYDIPPYFWCSSNSLLYDYIVPLFCSITLYRYFVQLFCIFFFRMIFMSHFLTLILTSGYI